MAIIELSQLNESAVNEGALAALGMVADRAASAGIFERYHAEIATATVVRHGRSLRSFAEFLESAASEFGLALEGLDFQHDPATWRPVTWGLVQAFRQWLLASGYAIGTINKRLDAVRVYAGMAQQAGFLSADELLRIRSVRGIAHKQARNINLDRERTRVSTKKSAAVVIDPRMETSLLFDHADSPAGRRNALIMALLLDHGLRASEVVLLTANSFDFDRGELVFHRPKTQDDARHRLTERTRLAAVAYSAEWPGSGRVFVGSFRDGRLRPENPLNTTTLYRLVNRLGKRLGVRNLSPHDCRHHCATVMARRGYDVKRLMDWFGWTSPVMAVRYIASQTVQERDLG